MDFSAIDMAYTIHHLSRTMVAGTSKPSIQAPRSENDLQRRDACSVISKVRHIMTKDVQETILCYSTKGLNVALL